MDYIPQPSFPQVQVNSQTADSNSLLPIPKVAQSDFQRRPDLLCGNESEPCLANVTITQGAPGPGVQEAKTVDQLGWDTLPLGRSLTPPNVRQITRSIIHLTPDHNLISGSLMGLPQVAYKAVQYAPI